MTTTTPALTGTLTAYNSRRDIYGNRYWAFTYQDHATGKAVSGTISGGESNIRCIRNHIEGLAFSVHELPIRQFNRMTKEWPYAGCVPEELAAFIRRNLEPTP